MENYILLTIIYGIWLVILAVHLILENRAPSKTLAWLLLLAGFPVLGFVIYLIFGQKYRSLRKLQSKKLPHDSFRACKEIAAKHAHHTSQLLNSIESGMANQKKWIQLLLSNLRAPVTENNRLDVFQNGKEAFQSIIEALQQATHHIHLEFYIIKNDQIGHLIRRILIQKAQQDVEVRVLYDAFGSRKLKKAYIRELKNAGVQITSFLPLTFPWLTSKINFRNHRKIIVVDGRIGFTGGLNIGDEYLGKGPLGHWRDTFIRIEGDAVYYLQYTFLKDWYVTSHEYVGDPAYFPEQERHGRTHIQIAASGPNEKWDAIKQIHFSLIASAKKNVFLLTPYLIPDESIQTALKTAALSGIDVRIVLPDKPEFYIVYYATKSYIEGLLEAGVRIYSYQKGFIHSKVILVDGAVASIGTANMDMRSLHYNFEVNAILYDEATIKDQESVFEHDLTMSKEILLSEYKNRSFKTRLFESGARLFSDLL